MKTVPIGVPFAAITLQAAIALHAAALTPNEVSAWREDVELLRDRFVVSEKGLTDDTRAAFLEALDALVADLPELDDPQVMVRLQQAVALARNAHTNLHNIRITERQTPLLPIRVFAFADGVYVVKARPEYRLLLGKRLVGVGNSPVDAAIARVNTLQYGNPSWLRYNAGEHLVNPAELYGLGLTTEPNAATLAFEDSKGSRETLELRADPLFHRMEWRSGWWALAPGLDDTDKGEWTDALNAQELPHYLRDSKETLEWRFLADTGTFYIRHNHSDVDVETRRRFLNEALAILDDEPVKRVVVDLRFNTGGDLMQSRGAYDRLTRHKFFEAEKRLYAVTGVSTFSAGLFAAAFLKSRGAIIAGEPAGDYLDFWAEGDLIRLPNSGWCITTMKGFHSYSAEPHPYAQYLHTDLAVETLEPDVPVPFTFSDYIAGRDAALEAITRN